MHFLRHEARRLLLQLLSIRPPSSVCLSCSLKQLRQVLCASSCHFSVMTANALRCSVGLHRLWDATTFFVRVRHILKAAKCAYNTHKVMTGHNKRDRTRILCSECHLYGYLFLFPGNIGKISFCSCNLAIVSTQKVQAAYIYLQSFPSTAAPPSQVSHPRKGPVKKRYSRTVVYRFHSLSPSTSCCCPQLQQSLVQLGTSRPGGQI